MNYKEHIDFNKSIISLYMKENVDKQYNQKIFLLIKENIQYYSCLNALRRREKIKPIKAKEIKTEKLIRLNTRPLKTMYTFNFFKESEVTEEDIEREIDLGFNLHKNN